MISRKIITGLGVYLTRGGRLAFIHETEAFREAGETKYLGYMLAARKRVAMEEWQKWSADGRCRSVDDHTYNLIKKL